MKLLILSEPSEVILEHLLLATDRQEQFAVIGRVAVALGHPLHPMPAKDFGVQSRKLAEEACRHGMSVDRFCQLIVSVVARDDLFEVVLGDGRR